MKKNRYDVYEIEKMPTRMFMENATSKEIAERLCVSETSCYQLSRPSLILGKYKVVRHGTRMENRHLNYFHRACELLAEKLGISTEECMKMVIKEVVNGKHQ